MNLWKGKERERERRIKTNWTTDLCKELWKKRRNRISRVGTEHQERKNGEEQKADWHNDIHIEYFYRLFSRLNLRKKKQQENEKAASCFVTTKIH